MTIHTSILLPVRTVLLIIFVAGPDTSGANESSDNLPNPQQEIVESRATLSRLQETVATLEAEEGAYSPELVQAWRNIGDWYLRRNEGLNAAEAFEKALHINKVNLGMQNISQAEIVELLINAYSQVQDWKELEKSFHYLLWLYKRNYEADNDALISVVERVARWYLHAYQVHKGGAALSYLVRADDLFDEAAKTVAARYGADSEQLIRILNTSATINYHIARDVEDVFRMSHRDIREAMIPNKRATPYFNEVAVRAFYFDQSFYKGRRSLKKIVELHKSNLPDSAEDYARSLVYQGDYYLSLNRKWNAMKNYQKAYNALIEHSVDAASIHAIFGQPRRVEPFRIPGTGFDVEGDFPYIDSVVDIPGNGWPRDIKIISTYPDNRSDLRKRGKHKVAATRFRPRFEAAQPVETTNVPMRYRFVHQ